MVQINVSEGRLEGELVQNRYGGTFYSFKGIPYAQPPVGELRFKAPQPPTPWEGVRCANQFGSKCFQDDIETFTGLQGSEDCLYLNVYTPNITPKKLLPVMFWIHGGALLYGSGEDDYYGPEFLIKQEVVIVTFNYRLGVLGFLCLHTKDIPGNAGMKDQVQALRWVNKNISQFGGDPDNVTIFGESAGGACVSYHLVSSMSKGLFKRAITQSGAASCLRTRAHKPRERALALARLLSCYSEDDEELYDFFKNLPVESLAVISAPILLSEKLSPFGGIDFSIAEEQKFGDTEIFFEGDFNAISEGVEIMVGYTTDEGIINLIPASTIRTKLETVRDFPEVLVNRSMRYDLTFNQQLEIGKKIRNYYFNRNNKIDISKDWEGLCNYNSMDTFVHDIISFAKNYAKRNKVYFYKFSCKSERNETAHLLGLAEIIGNKPVTSHGDDLFYLFDAKIISSKVEINSSTYQLIERVVKLWTNFGKHGNPTPDDSLGVKWKEYTVENQDYLNIGNEFIPGKAPDAEELKFWNCLLEEYGIIPC